MPADDIQFIGGINSQKTNDGQEIFVPFVELRDRDGWKKTNEFVGCGGQVNWDGVGFKSMFKGVRVLTSE